MNLWKRWELWRMRRFSRQLNDLRHFANDTDNYELYLKADSLYKELMDQIGYRLDD